MENVKETHPSRVAKGGRGSCRRCGGAEEFGVSVDVSRFFSDERAQVLTRACGARRVRWLLARLARTLALPPRLALLASTGPSPSTCLLPARDRLRLVRANAQSLQLISLPEHWCGQEGLRDVHFVRSADDVDAPAAELGCGNITENNLQYHDSEMTQEPEVELEQTCCAVSESESQTDANSELQRVKQHALELLERCAPPAAPATRRPRQRRRRPRRRAPPPSPPPPPPPAPGLMPRHSPSPMQQSPPLTRQSPPLTRQSPPLTRQSPPLTRQSPPLTRQSPPPTRQLSPPQPPRSPSVRRNRSPRATSAPRLVRALY